MNRIVRQFAAAPLAAVPLLVGCTAVFALGSLTFADSAFAASKKVVSASVAGVVSDSSGTPQLGVAVELLRADSTLAARVFTDRKGSYSFGTVTPGQYAVKAIGESFLPSLKSNLRIRTNTVVNLTLNTLYDVMQWAPRPQPARVHAQDDWAWTLRSAEGRPLLRWQEDGSPILVWDGANNVSSENGGNFASKRKARILATAGAKRFGSDGNQLSVAMREDTSARRRMAMSAEIAPDTAGLMDAMLGFRQEMTNTGLGSSAVQTLAAVMSDPEVAVGDRQGLQEASLRTWESLQVLDSLEAEAGSEQVVARAGGGGEIFAALPFAQLKIHHGQSALAYRVATARSADATAGELTPGAWLPILSERDGKLVLEHGLHQEVGWSTSAGPTEVQLVIFGDNIQNPLIEGSGRLTTEANAGQWVLLDRASGLLRGAGSNYSTAGMLASVESNLPGHNHVKLSYATGDALVMQTSVKAEDLGAILRGAHARRAQMYSLALSGTADGLGTKWRASYRWQPGATVTEVAPFAVDASEPYLNIYIRQPIRLVRVSREGSGTLGGLEAQVDLRNLLAEGYQPFLTSDGSQIYFAQAQRSIRGGLAFTF